jgi:LacI family transcriptional regulator, repressor for deo operon, udp, cdd, tsx, nupC, and nupG
MPPVKRNAIERRDAYIATMDRLGSEPIVLEVSARSWNFEAIGFEETYKILDAGGNRPLRQ